MRIAVNTRLLLKNKLEGIGWFAYETLKRITTSNPEHEFFFIFDRKYSDEFIFSDNITPVVAFPPTRHPYLTEFYFRHVMPVVIKKIKPDLFFSPDGWVPLKINIPVHTVIHDLNFEHHPELLPKTVIKHYQKCFPQYAHKARRIATVSEYTRQDIHNTYKIPLNKIDVVYNGSNEIYKPIDTKEQEKIRNEFTGGSHFFIFVSSIHPRKNLGNTIKAFYKFKETTGSDVKFVIVGSFMIKSPVLNKIINSSLHKKDLIFLGHVELELLHKLLASAIALLYVSFFEGFGIPIIEAMRCGTPVITSNVTSMPEVAGDAAIKVNPHSVNEILNAMKEIFANETLKNKLKEAGSERSKLFSWDNTAKFLWNSIKKSLL